jgi:hypothetical protein
MELGELGNLGLRVKSLGKPPLSPFSGGSELRLNSALLNSELKRVEEIMSIAK